MERRGHGTGFNRPASVAIASSGVLLAIAVAGALVAYQAFGWDPTRAGGDPWNYLAAGERLNAGHDLYQIGPGDRPVPLEPPYWSAPLLAPPPIAVAWRPLALLGDPSMVLWALACAAAVVAAVVALARGGRASFAPAAVLAAPVTLTALSGNFGALQLAAVVALWTWRDRPAVAGTLLACVVAVKVTPVSLLIWLAATRRFQAVMWFMGAGVAILASSIVGAGVRSWQAWLSVARESAPSPLAISSLIGLPALAVFVAVMTAVVAVAFLRRDRLTFAVAVVAGCLATPALYFQALGPVAALGAAYAIRSARRPAPTEPFRP